MNHAAWAQAYARKGWPVLPIWWPVDRFVCACPVGADCKDPGKHPLTAHGSHDATTDQDQIARWWRRWPKANVGLAPGVEAGFWVLDIDTKGGGAKSFQAAYSKHGMPDPTVVAITGGGGRHVLWRTWGAKVPNHVGLLPGVDVRGDGGVIVAPPSIHGGSGRRYEWHGDGTPGKVPLGETPNWVRVLVLAGTNGNRRRPGNFSGAKPRIDVDAEPSLGEGERNRGLFRLLCRLIWEDRDAAEVERLAYYVNTAKCSPPLRDREVLKILTSAERYRR